MTCEIVHNIQLSKKLYKIVLYGIRTVCVYAHTHTCNVERRKVLKYIGNCAPKY